MTAIKPMKAEDLKQAIGWGGPDPFRGIAGYLNGQWAAEPKVDGCRAQLVILPDRARFGDTRSASFPAFAQIGIPALGAGGGTVLDGEFLAPVMPGYDRALLNHSAGLFSSGPAAARRWLAYGPARLIAFDVLAVAGQDTTRLPYDDRRRLLEQIVSTVLDRYPGCGVELIAQMPAAEATIRAVLAAGGEGVILKRRAGRYEPGKRSPDWLKIKMFATVDCWLTGGYKPGKNSRAGTVGAVEVAVTAADGTALVIGHVAVKPAWLATVTAADGSLRPEMTGVVIEVMAQGINEYGLLRHPHMVRLRPDKTPAGCMDTQLTALARV
jgi:bifunctional non-homologous end joining protein LigD